MDSFLLNTESGWDRELESRKEIEGRKLQKKKRKKRKSGASERKLRDRENKYFTILLVSDLEFIM